MEKSTSTTNTSYQDLCNDILLKILMVLSIVDLTAVSLVCKSWYRASREPALWYKLDLSGMTSYFGIPKKLKAWSDEDSSNRMVRFMNRALHLSNGETNCLIFNFYVCLTNRHLFLAAVRTRDLKRLVLPISGRMSKIGIDFAMRVWRGGLESITITHIVRHRRLFSTVIKHCKNVTEMKLTCNFEEYHANALIKYTPYLRVLSLRSTDVNKKALYRILDCMEHLEVVNICHSIIWERLHDRTIVFFNIRDLQKDLVFLCLRRLMFCEREDCIKCKNNRTKTGYENIYHHLEDVWRQDDIPSLAH